MSWSRAKSALGIGVVVGEQRPAVAMHAMLKLVYATHAIPAAIHAETPAATCELLVEAFIEAGVERVLLISSDNVIDVRGLERLMASSEETGAAVMAALSTRTLPDGRRALSAFVSRDGEERRFELSDISETGLPVRVTRLERLPPMVIDVEQVKPYAGPRFHEQSEGRRIISVDEGFAAWLTSRRMQIWVDPRVPTVRVEETLAVHQGAGG